MTTVDVLKAQIVRDNLATPWGFNLVGGIEVQQPLKFESVTPGSPAARIGLKAGDEVVEIGDTETDRLTLQQAQTCIGQYGLSLILTLERKARGTIPHNPILHGAPQPAPLKNYQTFNMSGAQQTPVFRPGPGGKLVATASPPTGSPKTPDSMVAFFPKRKPVTQPTESSRPTSYQTYDMTGAPRPTVADPNQHRIEFCTARAMPFKAPPTQLSPKTYQPPAEAKPTYAQEPPRRSYDSSPVSSLSEYGYDDGGQTQSRTFRILQGLMENEDEPPPCALSPAHAQRVTSVARPVAPHVTNKQYNPPITSPAHAQRFTFATEPVAPPIVNKQYNTPITPPAHALRLTSAAKPVAPPVVNKQYNTPITLYSQRSIADSVDVDGMTLDDNDRGEPTKPVVKSDVQRMVEELDDEKRREQCGERTLYTKLGRKVTIPKRVVTNENPFAGASVAYRAYARKFAPPGGSTAIEDARERRQRDEAAAAAAAAAAAQAQNDSLNSLAEKERTMSSANAVVAAAVNLQNGCNEHRALRVNGSQSCESSRSGDDETQQSYVAYASIMPGPFDVEEGSSDF